MFKGLMSFAMVRTPVQALGFYIVYLLIGMLIGGLAGAIGGIVMGPSPGSSSIEVGLKWGMLANIPYVLAIGAVIVAKKKLGLGYYVLALVGAIVAIFGGSMFGLIPAAFITTRKVRHEQPAE
ncbi:MAG: hypothetical protein ACHP65_10185 [Legionellales bacterium]